VAQLTVGRAPAPTLDPPGGVEAFQVWTLPDGGKIAYRHLGLEGDAPPQGHPVIMLHGGPGVPILPSLGPPGSGPLDFLAESGFSVFYYDQRGAGFSGRRDLAREPSYTVASHVADLEGIRETLGAEHLILVGHGWGATLASQYLLAHPRRVSRMVALSPAPLWYPAHPDLVEPSARARLSDVQASALAVLEKPSLRLVLGRLTAVTSRSAAHTLVQDWEADEWWTRITRESIRLRQPHLTCGEQAQARIPPPSGLGYFAYSYTLDDALRLPDPRPALAEVETPTLIVRGFCDYIRWQVAYEYLQVLRDARQVSTSASGHLLWMEQPEILETVMIPFLAGEPVPLAYYHPERRP
jgi:pimeloyl-ACP methyl ester carboxylesterase